MSLICIFFSEILIIIFLFLRLAINLIFTNHSLFSFKLKYFPFAIGLWLLFFYSCQGRSYSKTQSGSDKVYLDKSHLNKQEKVLNGLVAGVTDGDTFTLLMDNDFSVKIRLNGIDCPEKKQDYSQKAKQKLSDLIFEKKVLVKYEKKDRYGRVLGDVFVDGISVNNEMVKTGYAWHYKKYSDDAELARLENEARNKKVGLWADSNPIPPWEFRNKN